jgi:triphosphoribosyl-dephospho-CoA synthase
MVDLFVNKRDGKTRASGQCEMSNIMHIGVCAQVACIWEATARKPGNVHRFRDFSDTSYVDFLVSAAAMAPALDQARDRRVGGTVLESVRATRSMVATNTNLGIALLLAPLAAVPEHRDLRSGVVDVLEKLDVEDARLVYEAIRLASPAGLGQVAEQDLSQQPTVGLRQAMALAADRDLVACQYVNGFHEVLFDGVQALERGLSSSLEQAIVLCYLELMAKYPDSLIARKRGLAEAEESARRARRVLNLGWQHVGASETAIADLDCWLRAEGNSRNPGTTADLVAASLFAVLREGIIKLPASWEPGSGW